MTSDPAAMPLPVLEVDDGLSPSARRFAGSSGNPTSSTSLSPQPGSPGLYTDQRRNRDFLRALIEERPSDGSHIGNLFATAAFSVACAAAGAERVVSVDLAQRYCEWAAQDRV